MIKTRRKNGMPPRTREESIETKRKELLKLAEKVAWKHLSTPYKWGGNDPMAGFDCSGFVIEILQSVGLLPVDGDWTAAGLFNKFKAYEIKNKVVHKGCLVFWGSGEKITHIEFAITKFHTIGASGGGSSTTSEQVAIKQDAYIKIRPIAGRSREVLKVVDPFASITT